MPTPSNKSRVIRWLLLLAFLTPICVLGSTSLLIAINRTSNPTLLPPPAPSLTTVERTLLGAYLLLNQAGLETAAGDEEALIKLEVFEGQLAGEVVDQLTAAGVVRNGPLLRKYLQYGGYDRGVEAGLYYLYGGMPIPQIARALQHARPSQLSLTIPEGWRMEQIADLIDRLELAFSGSEFLQRARTPAPTFLLSDELPMGASLEGFLFPDTYLVRHDQDAGALVQLMLANFEARLSADLRQGFQRQGLSIYQAVTLASIIEREAILEEELALIASVFLNRLSVGMHLQADPTTQYALGQQPDGSWWKTGLTYDDLAYASPYNTYYAPGLPPGPIANPGLAALRAVASPAESNFFYFRARCDGSFSHAFAVSYEEHLANACP